MTRPVTGPVVLVLLAVVSVQFGGALAATLLPLVGVAGSVALRLGIAAIVLLAVARPRLRGRSRADWGVVVGFGAALAAMNTSFYASLERLPIGVAVTIEFTGPLLLAAALSRRAIDLLAVGFAAVGVVLIAEVATVDWAHLDLIGIGLALLAGACWAGYIVLSGRAGARFEGIEGLALAMGVAALAVGPVGVVTAGEALWHAETLLRGLGIALLSSILPYSLELLALRRLDARVFGTLLSLEPAVAGLAGLVLLGQRLAPIQLVGMALVVAASGAVTRRKDPAPDQAAAEIG